MNRVYISAVSELPPGQYPNATARSMYSQLLHNLFDAYSIRPQQIDGLLTMPADASSSHGEYGQATELFMHERLYEEFGFRPRFAETIYAGGATYGIMVSRAAIAIQAGEASAVLCVGAGKFPKVSAGGGAAMAKLVNHPEFESIYGAYIPVNFGLIANRYMYEAGVSREDLASVAVSGRQWAIRNPTAIAYGRGALSIDQIKNGRPIASPFGLYDCSFPCEGGGALLVTSREVADSFDSQPCAVLGHGEYHSHGYVSEAPSLTKTGAGVSAASAFAMAGVQASEVDSAQLYDAYSVCPIMLIDELELASDGLAAAALFRDGATFPEGSFPVNTNGGLLSYGHTGRASGISCIIEGWRQLTGQAKGLQVDTRMSIIHTFGGMMAEHSTLLLGVP